MTRLASLVVVVFGGTAASWPSVMGRPYALISIGLFVGGCVLFLVGFLGAVGRSRGEEIALGAILTLSGAPRPARVALLGWLGVQIAAVVLYASLRPFTTVAFGILAPMFGLGIIFSWAARHLTFPERPAPT